MHGDMVEFASPKRCRIIVETMPSVGIYGGTQVTEPASVNTTTVDMIRQFGGSTHPSNKWPEEISLAAIAAVTATAGTTAATAEDTAATTATATTATEQQ